MAKNFEWLLKFPLDSIRISSAESTLCKHLSLIFPSTPWRGPHAQTTDCWSMISTWHASGGPPKKIIIYTCSKSTGKLHFEPEANSACLHVRGNNIVRWHLDNLDTFSNSRVTFRNSTFKCLESFEWKMQFHFMGNKISPIWAKPKSPSHFVLVRLSSMSMHHAVEKMLEHVLHLISSSFFPLPFLSVWQPTKSN